MIPFLAIASGTALTLWALTLPLAWWPGLLVGAALVTAGVAQLRVEGRRREIERRHAARRGYIDHTWRNR